MSRDTGTAIIVTVATAAATAISFIALTKADKANEGISLADLLASREDASENMTAISNTGSQIDRREQWYQAKMGSKSAHSTASINMTMSQETGASAEGDDTINELADYSEIFGSRSIYSDDSDSDISYDTESRNSFRDSLINLFDNNESLRGLVYESDRGMKGNELDPDNPFNDCIYLDYNGTTPIDRRVFAHMIPYLTLHFGNPSSSHAYGAVPKRAIIKARRSILDLLHPDSNNLDDAEVEESIVFTGCGTEADNMAIHLALNSTPPKRRKKKHIVTTNVEHPAVTECLKVLESKGEIDVTYVPVDSEGIVSTKQVLKAIRDETVLVTIMLANNESGALQPVKEIAPYCRKRGILFHTDAAQAVGKVSITLDEMGISDVDMVTIVAHKFGGPKGIACLYIRPGCLKEHGRKEPISLGYGSSGVLLHGGGQENGRRAGTENVPYIVGMGFAADILNSYTSTKKHRRWRKNASKMRSMRSRLLFKFKEAFQNYDNDIVRENGPKDPTKRLPNTLSIGFKDVKSGELLQNVQAQVACSAGSACHASGGKISGVLIAMNVPTEYARGTLRLSVGPTTTIDEVDKAAEKIIKEIKRQLKIEN